MKVLKMSSNSMREQKIYNSKWEEHPVIGTFIERVAGQDRRVRCKFCESELRAHKSDLLEHSKTKKHQITYSKRLTEAELSKFCKDLSESGTKKRGKRGKRRNPSTTSKQESSSTLPVQEKSSIDLGCKSFRVIVLESREETNGSLAGPVLTVDDNSDKTPPRLNSDNGKEMESVVGNIIYDKDLRMYESEASPSDLIIQEQEQITRSATYLEPTQAANILTNFSTAQSDVFTGILFTGIPNWEGAMELTLVNGATLQGPPSVNTSGSCNTVTNTMTQSTQTTDESPIEIVEAATEGSTVPMETENNSITPNLQPTLPNLSLQEVVSAIESGVFLESELRSLIDAATNKIGNQPRISSPLNTLMWPENSDNFMGALDLNFIDSVNLDEPCIPSQSRDIEVTFK